MRISQACRSAALLCASLALCQQAAPAAGQARRPSVVLVVLDSVRADRVGGADSLTPSLDAFAGRAAVFSNAYAGSNWTGGSFATMLTGRTTFEHGLLGLRDRLPPELPTIQSVLSSAGYAAAAFPSGIAAAFGFGRGFSAEAAGEDGTPMAERTRDALAWAGSLPPEKDFFLLLHGNDAHRPYVCPPGAARPAALRDLGLDFFSYYNNSVPDSLDIDKLDAARWKKVLALRGDRDFLEALTGSYDKCVSQLDEAAGQLLAGLNKSGRPLLVIFTADHGEFLGKRGRLDHGWAFYDAVARVPLLISFPGGKARRETALASHLDLLPTVCAAAGVSCPAGLPGRDLGAPPPPGPLKWGASSGASINSLTKATNSAYLENGLKLFMIGRRWQLFDLAADPGERNDLSASRPGDFLRLGGAYLAYSRAARIIASERFSGGTCFPPAAAAAPREGASPCELARAEAYGLAKKGYGKAAAGRLDSSGCPGPDLARDREMVLLLGDAFSAQRPEPYADIGFRSAPGLWSAAAGGYTVSYAGEGLRCESSGRPAGGAGCVRPAAALLSCIEKYRFAGKPGEDPASGRLGEALRRAGYVR